MFLNRMKKIIGAQGVPVVEIPTVRKSAPKKKAAAAAVSKKTTPAPKKTTTAKVKSSAPKQSLSQASEDTAFWVTNGQILRDLRDLAETFAAMDAVVYQYHVAKEKNDFADWVEHVLYDQACADSLRRARTPKTAHTVVIRHLQMYEI